MSHYFAQEMFSKVLVSPTLPSPYNTLKVSIVSDYLELLLLELLVKIQRWDELENHYRGSLPYANFINADFIIKILFHSCDFLVKIAKTNPKIFSASKCDVGNCIFSKLGTF